VLCTITPVHNDVEKQELQDIII